MLAACGLMIAAAGGIGGGGILVPIYILVLRFSPKYAVPLSNITIFGGAITNTFLNMKKRHPLADRPLVDWDLILVMEPLTSELHGHSYNLWVALVWKVILEHLVALGRCTARRVLFSLKVRRSSFFNPHARLHGIAPGSSTKGKFQSFAVPIMRVTPPVLVFSREIHTSFLEAFAPR